MADTVLPNRSITIATPPHRTCSAPDALRPVHPCGTSGCETPSPSPRAACGVASAAGPHGSSRLRVRKAMRRGRVVAFSSGHRPSWPALRQEQPASVNCGVGFPRRKPSRHTADSLSAPPLSKTRPASPARRNTSRIVSAGIRQAPEKGPRGIGGSESVASAGGSRAPAGARSVWRGRCCGSAPLANFSAGLRHCPVHN